MAGCREKERRMRNIRDDASVEYASIQKRHIVGSYKRMITIKIGQYFYPPYPSNAFVIAIPSTNSLNFITSACITPRTNIDTTIKF